MASLLWCSVQPGIAGIDPFYTVQSKYWSSQFLRTDVKIFPMHDVSAFSWKFVGDYGSFPAASFPMNVNAADFQASSNREVSQQLL